MKKCIQSLFVNELLAYLFFGIATTLVSILSRLVIYQLTHKELLATALANQEEIFKKVISHAKEYGYIFPSSEIYDGLSAVYDYAQNGVELKKNLREYWWKAMVQLHENIVGIDAAIFMHPTTWKASGHVDAFNDPLIDNKDSKKRYRADTLVADYVAKIEDKIDKTGIL